MNKLKTIIASLLMMLPLQGHAEQLTIAAASDLKFAMDEIVALFMDTHSGSQVDVVYGSSGRFSTQIRQGAPYDLYFSADIGYALALAEDGFAYSAVTPYARGRLVLWSSSVDATGLGLEQLDNTPAIQRIAMANPQHAPYGKRAEEALRSLGLWESLQPRLVFGESVSHAAQFVQTGNAQAGIIALSLALSPTLSGAGTYHLIAEHLHAPLEQGFIITRAGGSKMTAREFADFMATEQVSNILEHYGFEAPQ